MRHHTRISLSLVQQRFLERLHLLWAAGVAHLSLDDPLSCFAMGDRAVFAPLWIILELRSDSMGPVVEQYVVDTHSDDLAEKGLIGVPRQPFHLVAVRWNLVEVVEERLNTPNALRFGDLRHSNPQVAPLLPSLTVQLQRKEYCRAPRLA
jgi:hypothetical protein